MRRGGERETMVTDSALPLPLAVVSGVAGLFVLVVLAFVLSAS